MKYLLPPIVGTSNGPHILECLISKVVFYLLGFSETNGSLLCLPLNHTSQDFLLAFKTGNPETKFLELK